VAAALMQADRRNYGRNEANRCFSQLMRKRLQMAECTRSGLTLRTLLISI